MTALVATELLKLRTTARTTWGFVAAFLLLEGAGLGLAIGNAGRLGAPSVGTTEQTLAVLGAGGRNALVVLVLGAMVVTTEHRHATITGTLLTTPDRRRVLAAKAATVALVGATAAIASVFVAGVVGLTTGALDLSVVNGEIALTLTGLLLVLPAYGLLGVGIGALVQHQTAAIILPLLWFVVIETLIPSYGLRWLVPWTPAGAAAALARDASMPGLLPAWAGALLLVAYTAVLAGAGTARLVRTDIT